MLEGNLFDPLLLDATVKPLPWTKGGPNEDNMQQQPTSNLINSSVADPIFTIKNRVVTMKELEGLKKRLPPGIDIRVTAKNVIKFRARFRKTGQQEIIQTFPDLKLAKQWLAEQERNALLGIHLPPQTTKRTFADAFKRYSSEELPKKGDDARNRQHHLEWWNKHLGIFALAAVRPALIKEKLVILENEISVKGVKRAPATVVRYLASLSHLFAIAWKEWEWISENPVLKIGKPSISNSRQRYLSLAELNLLLIEVKKSKCPVLLPITVLALSTGMRSSEIMHLKWENINLPQGLIYLQDSKNGDPRFIPLKGYAHELLSTHFSKSTVAKVDTLVFPAPNNPAQPYDIRSAWREALKRANIKNFRMHDLRHTTASYHRMQGKGLHDIGSLLGHKDARSTARYAHISTEYKSKMVEDLDRELFGE